MKNDPLEILGSRARKKRNERALLHRIASQPLPCVLTRDEDLLAASALYQAGHVKITMQLVLDPLGGLPLVGVVVSEITRSGLRMLRIA